MDYIFRKENDDIIFEFLGDAETADLRIPVKKLPELADKIQKGTDIIKYIFIKIDEVIDLVNISLKDTIEFDEPRLGEPLELWFDLTGTNGREATSTDTISVNIIKGDTEFKLVGMKDINQFSFNLGMVYASATN